MKTTITRTLSWGALVGAMGTCAVAPLGCDGLMQPDGSARGDQPIAIALTPLTGTSCGDPDAPTPNADPFVDAPNITVEVRAFDTLEGVWDTLVKSSRTLRAGQSIKIARVPEGDDREVIVFAQGGSQQWYGRDTNLDVRRNADTVAATVLTRYGGVSCVPTPQGIKNSVFPAAVSLGDGRVLVTGGFTEVSGGKLTGASSQAFLFDPRTGQTEALPSMGANEGRAGHAAVFLEATNKVLLVGGMTELSIDTSKPFPYVFDAENGRDDYVIFDVAAKSFTSGTETMQKRDGTPLPRGFPRTAVMSDGTVLITGGGEWPFDPGDTDQIEASFFDPEDNDRAGGLLDIPPLRSFYYRAGHSLTFLSESTEGLYTYLVWGGTTPDRSLGHPAEIYRQSGRQREGVNGTFAEVLISGEVPPFSYFHETTRLSGGRFLATGGSRYASGALQAPENDEAWLLTFNSQPAPVLQTRRIAGFGAGRVFHTALSSDLSNVSIIGGWGPVDAAQGIIKTFDLATSGFRSEDAAAALTTGRGGHAGLLTTAGTVLLIGGESSATTPAGAKRMAAEIYTPTTMPVP